MVNYSVGWLSGYLIGWLVGLSVQAEAVTGVAPSPISTSRRLLAGLGEHFMGNPMPFTVTGCSGFGAVDNCLGAV